VAAREDPGADTGQEPGGNLNGLFIIEIKTTAKLEIPKNLTKKNNNT